KNIQCSSRESVIAPSFEPELIAGPRFIGGPHGLSALSRCVTQMSFPPNPPRRDAKYRVRPSFEIEGAWSSDDELTTGPRLTGVVQAEKRGAADGRGELMPTINTSNVRIKRCQLASPR